MSVNKPVNKSVPVSGPVSVSAWRGATTATRPPHDTPGPVSVACKTLAAGQEMSHKGMGHKKMG